MMGSLASVVDRELITLVGGGLAGVLVTDMALGNDAQPIYVLTGGLLGWVIAGYVMF